MSAERVALITTDARFLGDQERDIGILADRLGDRGLEVSTPIWHDPGVAWEDFDVAIMRSPWDYPGRVEEFMTWLDDVSTRVPVLNPPELIRWDMDKRYLVDLVEAGVPCAPFEICETRDAVVAALGKLGSSDAIVKPTVSAGSASTGWFAADDPAALELAGHILAIGKAVLVQPAIADVVQGGENALIFFNGAFAGSFHKGPILTHGGGYIGGSYTEDITRGHPSDAEMALGEQVMAALASIGAARGWPPDACHPLYARLDLALAGGRDPMVLEIEAFEPAYFVDIVPEVADRFADAVVAWLAAR